MVALKKYPPLHKRDYLKERRPDLRNNSTSAEAILWIFLNKRQLENRKFRRQHSIANYIVDFYCHSEMLIIEVDGEIHSNPAIAHADGIRDEKLRSLGFKILRIRNREVFHNIDMVLERIKHHFRVLNL